mgnify:CR=1 FL=1
MDRQEGWFTLLYRHIIPESIRRKCSEMMYEREMNRKTLAELERRTFGDLNKDKTFYVIRTDNTQGWGVFSTYLFVLSNVKYAVEHGWIPVVDYKNYFLVGLQNKEERGKENAWNYYFEDLVPEFPLEEVYQSRNVILGPLRGQPYGSISWGAVTDVYIPEYQVYFKLAAKYIRMQSYLLEQVESEYQKLFPREGCVLGVGIRAGAYWGTITGHKNWDRHPKGVSVERCIENIKLYLEKYSCDYFFLSCEDRYFVNTIQKEFGDKCLCLNRSRASFFDDQGNPSAAEDIKYEEAELGILRRNIEYVKEVILLTRCQYLIRTRGGGNLASLFIKNGRYEEMEEIL